MFSLVEAFLLLSYTGMVYALSCIGFLVLSLCRELSCCYRTQGWCMFSLVEAFFLLSYTGMCMFSPVEAFLMLSYTGMVYVLSFRGCLDVILHRDVICSLL